MKRLSLTNNPGAFSAVVLVVIIVILTGLDLWLSGSGANIGSNQSSTWSKSDVIALQQLVLAVILVPTAIYGFLTTAAAFRKAQAVPVLKLQWFNADEQTPYSSTVNLLQRHDQFTGNSKSIALINTGTSIAVWYLVRLEIPIWPRHNPLEVSYDRWVPHIAGNYWQMGMEGSIYTVTFRSNGQLACFPDFPIDLGHVLFRTDHNAQYPELSYINYTILTDNTALVSGKLEVRLQTM